MLLLSWLSGKLCLRSAFVFRTLCMPIPSRFAKPPFSARKGGFAEPAYSARKWVCFRPLSRLGSLLTPPNSGRKRGVWPTHDLGSKRRVLKLCSCWTQTTHRKDLVMCQNLMQDFQPVGPTRKKNIYNSKDTLGQPGKLGILGQTQH